MSPKTLLFASIIAVGGAAATVASAASVDGRKDRQPIQAAVMFNMLDQNGDGVIDTNEIDALASAIMAAVDTDGDGALSQTEFGAVARSFGPHGRQGQQFGRGPGPGERGNFHRGPRGGRDSAFQRGPRGADAGDRQASAAERFGIDEDGLTQEEFLLRQTERFAQADADGDGTITLEEFAAAAAQFRGPPRIR